MRLATCKHLPSSPHSKKPARQLLQATVFSLPLLYAVVAAALALIGYGAYSIDAAVQLTWSDSVVWAVLALGVIGGFANLAVRKTGPVEAHV